MHFFTLGRERKLSLLSLDQKLHNVQKYKNMRTNGNSLTYF